MTARTFVIGDLHLGHKLAAKMRGFSSVEEHNETIVERCNSVLTKNDVLIVLGDVVFGKDNFKYLEQIKGTKKLILGNHDKYSTRTYLEYFTNVHGSLEYAECILTHIPVHETQLKTYYAPDARYKKNIHAHLHENTIWQGTMDGSFMKDSRYICVSADQINLTPVLLDSLVL